MASPDYGVDAPRTVRNFALRGATLAVVAAALWISNGASAGPLAGVCISIGATFLAVSAIMYFSSRVLKPRMCDRILDQLAWRGDEKVLDVGCGRGLFLIGAAKRLTAGRATGVDIWQAEDLSGNSPERARENARVEGVSDKVKIDTADARTLPFPDSSFDVAVSSLALHNIPDAAGRDKALEEIVRVLKPGGQIAILDIFHTPAYAKTLRQMGLAEVKLSRMSLPWVCPTWHVIARKK
jgi:arsenite methyltransferase